MCDKPFAKNDSFRINYIFVTYFTLFIYTKLICTHISNYINLIYKNNLNVNSHHYMKLFILDTEVSWLFVGFEDYIKNGGWNVVRGGLKFFILYCGMWMLDYFHFQTTFVVDDVSNVIKEVWILVLFQSPKAIRTYWFNLY